MQWGVLGGKRWNENGCQLLIFSSHGPLWGLVNYWHSWGWKIWQIPAAFVGYKTTGKWHDSSLGAEFSKNSRIKKERKIQVYTK